MENYYKERYENLKAEMENMQRYHDGRSTMLVTAYASARSGLERAIEEMVRMRTYEKLGISNTVKDLEKAIVNAQTSALISLDFWENRSNSEVARLLQERGNNHYGKVHDLCHEKAKVSVTALMADADKSINESLDKKKAGEVPF